MIPTRSITEDTGQPRSNTDEEALAQLADSIRRHGILNPITVVTEGGSQLFRIVTGERRWRAAKLAGLAEVPCIVRALDADDVRVQQLIENMQREDLQPLDRARGIAALQDQSGASVRDVAAMLGVSERTVSSLLDLLELPKDIGQQVVSSPNRPAQGQITEKHARFIKQLADRPDEQRRVATRVRADGLTSEDTASLVRALRQRPELSEEILTAPREAFSGYLKARDRGAEQRAASDQEDRDRSACGTVRACVTALTDVRPVSLSHAGIADLQSVLAELRDVIAALERECALELSASA
jgi:ParB family chromosome partitioning protein